MTLRHLLVAFVLAGTMAAALPALEPGGIVSRALHQQTAPQPTPQQPTPPPQQPSEIGVVINAAGGGGKPHLAIPEFSAVGASPEAQQAAKVIATVLWDDMDFEQEYYLIPREEAAKVPAASSPETLAYERWGQLGTDAVLLGTVRQAGAGIEVEVQLIGIRGDSARKRAFGASYKGCTIQKPRYCAHFIADEIHKQQRNLEGVARTRLAFTSDRNNELVAGRFNGNKGKEIYISDYDGANPQRITVNKEINVSPAWSPDGRSLAYTSFATHFPDIYIQSIYDVKLTRPAAGTDMIQNSLPNWSPDGTRIVFTQVRGDGNTEIVVMNRDGSNMRRLTNNPLEDTSPSWSPTGNQIVFVSGRSGNAQLYLINPDGTNLERLDCGAPQCDRPSWSGAINKIAYTCGSNASGYDICLLDMSARKILKLTDGLGSNEQPSFAANGRHIVFVTTRWGKQQLAMVDITGQILKRRITDVGNNTYPSWSRTPQ